MRHVPHLIVGAPWPDGDLPLTVVQWRHLTKVLRKKNGDPVTYSDGLGRMGEGRLGSQVIVRGEEATVPRPADLTVVVAPPANKDRCRFLVEKLAEMGVARLLWLDTRHGEGRAPSAPKAFSWVLAATEQSRGAWLMEVSGQRVGLTDLEPGFVVCDQDGMRETPRATTVVIGPEGGWADGEVPADAVRWSLGDTVLRVETAAVVAAARVLGAVGRN
ncbi:MAG TPA: 16S rRNA (uracil(1498)-N(3))-methyltransferase [Acidimicrobiia bacterium]